MKKISTFGNPLEIFHILGSDCLEIRHMNKVISTIHYSISSDDNRPNILTKEEAIEYANAFIAGYEKSRNEPPKLSLVKRIIASVINFFTLPWPWSPWEIYRQDEDYKLDTVGGKQHVLVDIYVRTHAINQLKEYKRVIKYR